MARVARYDRQAALEKAVVLFWEKGYHASSVKQIEHALDMRPGSIYAAFGSKDGLFSEALNTYAEKGSQHLVGHLADYEFIIPGLQQYLRDIASACVPVRPAPSRACMIVKTLLEVSNVNEPIARQVNALLASIEHGLAEALEQAKAHGELKPEVDCARLARLLQAQIMGLRSFAQRDTSARSVLQLGDDMAGLLDQYRT